MPTATQKRAAFRSLHLGGFFVLPNVWDAGGATRVSKLGFRALASTSSGAAWAAGRDDGELTLEETLDHLSALVSATDLPVNADFENGFADKPEGVAANVARALDRGVAAVSIEDWSGSSIYEPELAVERLLAARAAIDAIDPEAMLIGRHEQFRDPVRPIGEAIERAAAYAAAGADCIFVPMVLDHVAISELVDAVRPKPLSVLVHSYDEQIPALAGLGVRRCSVGGSLAKASWSAFDKAAGELKDLEAVALRSAGPPAAPHAAEE